MVDAVQVMSEREGIIPVLGLVLRTRIKDLYYEI